MTPGSGRSAGKGKGYPLQYSSVSLVAGKESTCNAGGPGLIPRLGRSNGEGIGFPLQYSWASLLNQLVKNRLQCRRPGFSPWVWKIPWRMEWLATPVPLPGKSHGQRSLVGYSPWSRKESDTIERLHFHFHIYCSLFYNSQTMEAT